MRKVGLVALAGFISTVFAANWLIAHVGIVPVGFGLMAPSGVFVVGLAFTFRDVIHRTIGRQYVLVGIAIGAVASVLVSPQFALASATAFAVSELSDLLVYQRFAARDWTLAVAASNTVGLIVDSALFLWLAFGSLAFLPGQVLGKAYMTAIAVVLIAAARPTVSAEGGRTP